MRVLRGGETSGAESDAALRAETLGNDAADAKAIAADGSRGAAAGVMESVSGSSASAGGDSGTIDTTGGKKGEGIGKPIEKSIEPRSDSPILPPGLGAMLNDDALDDLGDEDEHTAVAGQVMLRATSDVQAGLVLADRYQIEAPLGEGGSGTVYRAWDRILGELIAVKILHPERAREKSWIKRLAREVRVARAIGHPNVCRVFELGHADGRWFVTMELATGGSLRDLLRAPSSGTERILADRLSDMRELCAGLAAMHAVAITHRDVTPQNVLRMANGRLVLTDFGLAIENGDQTTIHGGTPAYLPPEAARGERSDQRSDVFQLGMIMHEVLTGVRPTWAADGSRLILVEPATGATAVEEEIFRLIADCVNSDPARRPQSAVAVAGRLAAAEVAQPPPFPVRVAARLRRYVRRHTRLMAAAAAAIGLAGVVRTVQVLSRPPLCQGAAQQLAGIWDRERTEAVRRSFVAGGKSYAADTFTRVRSILDDYANAWTRMYTDACEATHLRGEQSTDVLDLRMGCLKNGQGELRALTDLFSSAQGEVVSRSINAASELAPVARCADIEVLKAVVRPPADAYTRAHVDEMRQRLSETKALVGTGRFAEAARQAAPLVAEARALGYEPVLAEALDSLGHAQQFSGPVTEAETVLDEAMIVAEASRHDRVLAEAAVDKADLLGVRGRVDQLNSFVPRAEATLKRLGGDDRLQGWIYAAVGTALINNGRYAEGLVANQKGLDFKRRVLPPDHWDVALSLGNVASSLHSLGRDTEALVKNEQAIVILERALGRQHPDLALHIYNRGEIRLALGQLSQARSDFDRSLLIWKGELPANHIYNSYPLTGIGLVGLANGQAVADGIDPLERALAIREASAAPPELRAETAFALARALWQAGTHPERDRARAVHLAESARDLFPAGKAEDRRRVEDTLAAWQRTLRGLTGAAAVRSR